MLGLLGTIKALVATILSIGWWLVLGGALAFLGALFRLWLGYAGVAVAGAVIMFFAVTSGYLSHSDQTKIARLEAENRALAAKKTELELTGAALRNTLDKLNADAAANEETNDHLQAIIAALSERKDCVVPKEFTDELKKLR